MPNWLKRRTDDREIENQILLRRTLNHIQRFIDRLRAQKQRYRDLAARSVQLGDSDQARKMAVAYIRTEDMITTWQRYLVSMEAVALQRDQATASTQFIQSMRALSSSMILGPKSEDAMKMQVDMERALQTARTLEETMSVVMSAAADSIFSTATEIDPGILSQLENQLASESEQHVQSPMDDRVDDGLRRIGELLRKETP